MLLVTLAAAMMAADPTAAAVIEACAAQATSTQKTCEGTWHSIRLRLDPALKGWLRVAGGGAWTTDCPYDAVHRSGGCAIVAKGVMFVQPYHSDTPAIVWGDRNAERRERVIRFADGREANWTDAMDAEDTRTVLLMLTQGRRATFGWRAARARVLSETTLDLTGFADLRLLLSAMTHAAARAHQVAG